MSTKKVKSYEVTSPEPTSPESNFSISLTLGDQTFTSTGTTAAEALQKLERPTKIVTKGFLTLTHGSKIFKRMFMPPIMKRILANAKLKVIWADMLSKGLK